MHVRDLARAVTNAAVNPRAIGNTFFLSNERPVQWPTLFEIAAGCAGRRLAIDVSLPRPLVMLGARVGDVWARVRGRAGLLTSEKVALSAAPFWVCTSARARERLGFSTPTSLQDGVGETYHWYLANGWL